eukprot:2400862-Rhodomonas_salina.3
MEIAVDAYEAKLEITSTGSGSFTSIFGDNDYADGAKQLAVNFASAIDDKYTEPQRGLSGRVLATSGRRRRRAAAP